jgi:protein involved in polysaccharide export with SLBB domain
VVALAGGVTETGRPRDVRLLRGGVETRIDLAAPATALAPIRSGDQIFVDRRTSVFREYIAPAGGLIAALAALANLLINN